MHAPKFKNSKSILKFFQYENLSFCLLAYLYFLLIKIVAKNIFLYFNNFLEILYIYFFVVEA